MCLVCLQTVSCSQVQWNLSYPNSLGLVESEKSISLKVCINSIIGIICNNGLEMRIQINTITVPYPRYSARKIMVSTAGASRLLESYEGMFVTYSWINYHLH